MPLEGALRTPSVSSNPARYFYIGSLRGSGGRTHVRTRRNEVELDLNRLEATN